MEIKETLSNIFKYTRILLQFFIKKEMSHFKEKTQDFAQTEESANFDWVNRTAKIVQKSLTIIYSHI